MEDNLTAGPYRATLLWNNLIRTFRSDIPLARHRRYMKTYDECFVASDAVEWLHQYLKNNPNFGTNVSRAQTVQLLQKLHKARVFEDVRGPKHNRGEFTDSGRLFRLTLGSPAKSIRTPIALRNNLKLANLRRSPAATQLSPEPVKLDLNQLVSLPELSEKTSTLPECHFVAKPLSSAEVQEEWKIMTLLNLQKVLGIENLEEIMESHLVSGKNIMHNCLYINKSGVVTNIDPKDQLPHWALSAMKCLAYWPDKIDENLPSYPGFEKDVFRVVKDYFCGLPTPLMTYEMYEVITNIFVKAGKRSKAQMSTANLNYSTPVHLNNFKSVENLLLNLTNVYNPTSECQESSEGYSSSNILDLSPIHPVNDSIGLQQERISGELQPVTRYETAFGPDNRTVTRVFYADGIATDFNHCENVEGNSEEHTPIETHFDNSPPDSKSKPFTRQSSIRHSMHSLIQRHLSKDKKLRREKTMSTRRSTGYNLNDDRTYGCSVGVYTRTFSDTPPSRLSSFETSNSSRRYSSVSDKIISRSSHSLSKPQTEPPSYDTLFPESRELKENFPPVLDGAKKLKRKKSMSSASLHRRHTCADTFDSSDSGREDSRTGKTSNCDKKEGVSGRSLSMSDLGAAPPIENELQKQCQEKLTNSEDSVFYDDTVDRIKRALQLVLLLIPPANRRRLHLLLRLMNKISSNEKLVLDDSQPSRNLLLETFFRAILCSPDESEMDELLVIQLVSFLMDHYLDIMAVPVDLKVSVEERLTKVQRTKIRYSSDESTSLHYCEQVTLEEYENQKLTSSQQAIATLLEELVNDKSMAAKEKRKRLKQFQKMYPDIYTRRFPSSQSEASLFPSKPKIKQPLFTRPLLKLKGLRL